MKKIITLVTCIAVVCGSFTLVKAKGDYTVKRIAGENRYSTSASICKSFSDDKVDNIIIASGENFPDALAGSGLSKKLKAPILLVDKEVGKSEDSIKYIKDHLNKDGKIYMLGGTASVSDAFVKHFKSLGYKDIIRLGGKDRFDTNRIIVENMQVEKGTPIVITNGYGFADALSVSSAAASKGYPIFMSESNQLSETLKSKIKEIQPSKVYLIGGNGSLSGKIVSQVTDLGVVKITRLGGEDRYDTSLKICEHFALDSETAIIANGENFPDALSGSALAGKENAPIILTDGKSMSKQKEYIDGSKYKNLILLGGVGAIDNASESILKEILKETLSNVDIVKNKSNYNFNIKDNNGDKFSAYFYCDDEKIFKVREFKPGMEKSWGDTWPGGSEGDVLSKGHYKVALIKDGTNEVKIDNFYGNNTFLNDDETILKLNCDYIKAIKTSKQGMPDFLVMFTPTGNDFERVNIYYIKDGKLNAAKFKNEKGVKEDGTTVNLRKPFLNLTKDNILQTSHFTMDKDVRYYVYFWNFNVDSGCFEYIENKMMNKDEYLKYCESVK